MKKPDKLILIAVWQFITAFMSLIVIATVVSGYREGSWSVMGGRMVIVGGSPFWLSVVILLLFCFLALAIVGGVGLMLNRGRAWARMVSIVHNALSLIAIPVVGTIIGTLSIIYLAKQDVRDYFNPPPKP
jgi:hypothetical protein